MADNAELTDHTTLDRTECLRLLAAGTIGRVVCTDGALPTAEPVSYILVGEEIIFRTRGNSRLAAVAHNAVVAFEVDDFDAETATSWSVLGVGKTYEMTGAHWLADVTTVDQHPALKPAAVPHHDAHHPPIHVVAIPLWRLTGRRLIVNPSTAQDAWA